MSNKDVLLHEIEQVPDAFIAEIIDFIRFLKAKVLREKNDTAIASESSLNKDWLKPEEDKAWQDL
ncbi:MAG TPA: DUF2281 domain-containing protein [bacterium]